MNEEMFDVVNPQDEVVGHASRRQVHAQRLMHRAVHVLIFNARGEVFLQKRSRSKDTAPGRWDSSASGHVDLGEDYDACAVRELQEELGLVLARPPARLFKLAACTATGQEHVWVYRGEAEGPFSLHPEEIEQGRWISPRQLSGELTRRPQDFSRAFVSVWEHWCRT